jgi:hypothetical protein
MFAGLVSGRVIYRSCDSLWRFLFRSSICQLQFLCTHNPTPLSIN